MTNLSDSSMLQKLYLDHKMTPKQQQIIQAAIELIAEKGYASTSTNEIAIRAGVAEGTIFRHYKTKKDLLYAIIHPVTFQFFAPIFADDFMEGVFDQNHTTLEEFLTLFIHNRLQFIKENQPIVQIIMQELIIQPEIQATFKTEFKEKIYPSIVSVLDHFKVQGVMRNLDNERIMRMMIPSILGFLVTRFFLQPDKEWDDEQEIKQVVTFIVKGLHA